MEGSGDIRIMGGLKEYMPITRACFLIYCLAIAGVPMFAGFFSKDAIIEAVHFSNLPGHTFAYVAVMAGVFITALYSFRMLFLAFHGPERFHGAGEQDAHGEQGHDASHAAGSEPDAHAHEHGKPRESPWVVTVPLILLAIPSVYAGWAYIQPVLMGDYFGDAIVVVPGHPAMERLREEWHGVVPFILHGAESLPLWLAFAGIATAIYCYLVNPAVPDRIRKASGWIYTLLDNKYYFDRFNDWFFAGGARRVGAFLSNVGDRSIIDGFFVNGTARLVALGARLMRHMQSGYVYHYAFTMIVGLFALLSWWTLR